MPWGLTRFQQSGQSHFVTFCCYHRRPLFTTDVSCRIFESALERVRHTFGLQVYGYVVMPEHVHLLLSEPQRDTLADALKSLKQGVSRRLINCDQLGPKAGNGALIPLEATCAKLLSSPLFT
jgi:putative transposase